MVNNIVLKERRVYMKKFFVIVLMLMMVLSVYAAIDESKKDTVNLVLNLEDLPDGSEKIEVGFSSIPVNTFETEIGAFVNDTIALTANPENGSFSFTTASGNGLYAYARLQTSDNVKIKFSGAELNGYKNAESTNSVVSGAGLDWILNKAENTDNNINAPESFTKTFDGIEAESDVLFEHRKDSSGNAMDIYCMAIDIASVGDYREIAMANDVNYWKTVLTVGVEAN